MTAPKIVGQAGAPSPSAGAPAPFTLSEDRRSVALEATWEIESLAELIYDQCRCLGDADQDQAELMRLQLKMRGLTARVSQLSLVVNAVLDNDEETPNLFKQVHGHALREVAHG